MPRLLRVKSLGGKEFVVLFGSGSIDITLLLSVLVGVVIGALKPLGEPLRIIGADGVRAGAAVLPQVPVEAVGPDGVTGGNMPPVCWKPVPVVEGAPNEVAVAGFTPESV